MNEINIEKVIYRLAGGWVAGSNKLFIIENAYCFGVCELKQKNQNDKIIK